MVAMGTPRWTMPGRGKPSSPTCGRLWSGMVIGTEGKATLLNPRGRRRRGRGAGLYRDSTSSTMLSLGTVTVTVLTTGLRFTLTVRYSYGRLVHTVLLSLVPNNIYMETRSPLFV
jgi:hypothetical protein